MKIGTGVGGEEPKSVKWWIFLKTLLILSAVDQDYIWLNVIYSISKFMPWNFQLSNLYKNWTDV